MASVLTIKPLVIWQALFRALLWYMNKCHVAMWHLLVIESTLRYLQ